MLSTRTITMRRNLAKVFREVAEKYLGTGIAQHNTFTTASKTA